MENPNTPENRNTDTRGGNYIENLGHDYVQRDKIIINYGSGSDKTESFYNNQKILHIILIPQSNDYVSLRYFWENASNYKEYRLSLAEIKGLSDRAETDYYTGIPADYATTGQALYNWLDKSEGFLATALQQPHPQGLVIAIATAKGLANLPWELLHDGKQFLVEKTPPIIPVRWMSNGKPIVLDCSPQNRPLNVLFMATSPMGVEPELDYEAEEGRILEATKRVPLNLRVEESGCLDELGYVAGERETGYFDVFHLTGYAGHENESSYFITEDEYGQRVNSNSCEIADAFKSSLPRLIFLSSCRTGYASNDAIPSMAKELLNKGATAVVGWGERVRDIDASVAAGMLYQELSQGRKVTGAIASAYKALIKQKISDWHKLRLYVGSSLPQELVTPLEKPGRKQLPKPLIKKEFLDDQERLRVVSRENFVGRRRQLQNCLRTLKTDDDKVGVLIHGMGGLGKSSIASRLWERLAEYQKILWWRNIYESSLIKKLKEKLINPQTLELISYLENSQIELEYRLVYLFNYLADSQEKPFLFIFDDFEWNLERRTGEYIPIPEVAQTLEALVQAIRETGTKHKILITCRYNFNSKLLNYFYKQGLDRFTGSVLTKKVNRLNHFNSNSLPQDLRERALILADGNPRLLEFLDEILGKSDSKAELTKLEQSPELWKEKVIWDELYQLIDEPLQKILSHCLVYEIPVPMAALEAVCESLPNYKQQLQRGIGLALIDVSSETEEGNRVYRASRILPHIMLSIKLPEEPEVYSLYQKASEKLDELWGVKENKSEEQWQEIFRLKFANKENSQRFREGFYQMLSVQHNSESDLAFESELRKVASDLADLELCKLLQNNLKQQQWKEADEETAWIFYQVMVKENHEDWEELLKNFPCEILREINQLWLVYSENKFGISLQAKIYQSIQINNDTEKWDNFGDHVGWRISNAWQSIEEVYNSVQSNKEEGRGLKELMIPLPSSLPALIYTSGWGGIERGVLPVGVEFFGIVYSLGEGKNILRHRAFLLSRKDL